MKSTITKSADGAILRPGADVVAESQSTLRSDMRDLVASGVKNLTVDLADVRMIDSSGLGLLIAAHNSLRKSGGQLSLIHATHDLLELFRTMRMDQHFSISGE